jgi:Bacterial PH domain
MQTQEAPTAMQPIEFRAPWGKHLKTATVFSVVMLGLVLGAGVYSSLQGAPWFAVAVLFLTPALLLGGALPFMVRGYVLTEEAIFVERLGWRTRLPLAGLQSAAGDVTAMHGAWRLFGNGGLFSFTGEFWSRRLGRFRALATDPDRAVVLRWPQRTIVITPHDPQHFIMRVGTLLQHARFEHAIRPG